MTVREPEHWSTMRQVAVSLPAFGSIHDQRTGRSVRYDPDAIAPHLQGGILDYITDPAPEGSQYNDWLVALASRQVGKSATAATGVGMRGAYSPGSYSGIIADKKERAEDLFRAILHNHERLPEHLRSPTNPVKENRQLSYQNGAKIRTLSAQEGMVGIGRAFDNLHLSEVPFWPDAAGVWNGILPAIINREETLVIMESTPAELSQPSAEWFRDVCADARMGTGRWRWLFAPFYSSKLNERQWDPEWVMTSYEAQLMEKWGPRGLAPESAPGEWRYLTLENLAFRREVMAMDGEIRRNPELFEVFFPVDSLSCWKSGVGGVIPPHAIEKHLAGVLVPWGAGTQYKQYASPQDGVFYIIGADPAGWGGGDHASFQVLAVWADRLEQVATFSSNGCIPDTFARILIEEAAAYNDALIICENNGVGLATTSLLHKAVEEGIVLKDANGQEKRYSLKNMYYHEPAGGVDKRPGWPSTKQSLQQAMAALIDELLDRLVLRDEETVNQLGSYRRDKDVQEGDNFQILHGPGKNMKGRRAKHHWDRISALMIACLGARMVPTRFRNKTNKAPPREGENLPGRLTFAEEERLEKIKEKRSKTLADKAREQRYKPTRRKRSKRRRR